MIGAYGFPEPAALEQMPMSVVNAVWPFFRHALHHLSAKSARPFFLLPSFFAAAAMALKLFAKLSHWPPAGAGAAIFCPLSDIGSAFVYNLTAAAAVRIASRSSSIVNSIEVILHAYLSGQPWMTF